MVSPRRDRGGSYLEFGLWLILSSRAVSAAVSSLLRTVTALSEPASLAASLLAFSRPFGLVFSWLIGENTRAKPNARVDASASFRDASWLPGDQCAPRFATKLGGHLCETSSHQCSAYGE